MKSIEIAAEIIKKYEGLRLISYLCPAGIWTIGYGHTATAKPNMTITLAEANKLLASDIAVVVDQLIASLGSDFKKLSDNKQAALISFVFNLGIGAFNRSTLKKHVIAGNTDSAAKEFMKWVYAGKTILPGLVKRRTYEASLYASDT